MLLYKSEHEEVFNIDLNDLVKRLYKIVSFESDGRIVLRHHHTAKPDKELKRTSSINWEFPNEKLRLSVSQFNALIEGVDFKLTPLGNIEKI